MSTKAFMQTEKSTKTELYGMHLQPAFVRLYLPLSGDPSWLQLS